MTPGLTGHRLISLELLNRAGVSISSEKELPYGVQLTLEASGKRCRVNLYHSAKKGSSVVPAGGDPDLLRTVQAILGGKSSGSVPLNGGVRAGTDEAGKGDYFGPLVAAAVSCGEEACMKLLEAGAGDSKRLTRRKVRGLYEMITEMDDIIYSVRSISPGEYNTLFAGFRSRGMNSLDIQAKVHGEAISGILEKGARPDRVIIDRFCEMPRLRPWLPGNCPAVELMVRAEDREPAVAAASIIARSVYLEELQLLSARFGVPLSPGAGAPVDLIGKSLVSACGEQVLVKTAKLHFSNTLRIAHGA